MSLETLVRALFTDDQISQLGDPAIASAIDNALSAYSSVAPRLLIDQVYVLNNTAPLPDFWVAGFSEIQDLTVVELAPAAPEPGEDGVTINFSFNEWVLSGEHYYLDLIHNVESLTPIVQLQEGNTPVQVDSIESISSNTTRLWIPATPDVRFSGTASIERP